MDGYGTLDHEKRHRLLFTVMDDVHTSGAASICFFMEWGKRVIYEAVVDPTHSNRNVDLP